MTRREIRELKKLKKTSEKGAFLESILNFVLVYKGVEIFRFCFFFSFLTFFCFCQRSMLEPDADQVEVSVYPFVWFVLINSRATFTLRWNSDSGC
jgi:hypothetical protein